MLHLVAYDIPDDGRRARVARILLDYGVRVQKSVFECVIESGEKTHEMVERLRAAVVEEEDAVRLIPVCGACADRLTIIGRGIPTADPDVYIV